MLLGILKKIYNYLVQLVLKIDYKIVYHRLLVYYNKPIFAYGLGPINIFIKMRLNEKVRVLTGDKRETAINIGYSCNLLNSSMNVLLLDESNIDNTRSSIEKLLC